MRRISETIKRCNYGASQEPAHCGAEKRCSFSNPLAYLVAIDTTTRMENGRCPTAMHCENILSLNRHGLHPPTPSRQQKWGGKACAPFETGTETRSNHNRSAATPGVQPTTPDTAHKALTASHCPQPRTAPRCVAKDTRRPATLVHRALCLGAPAACHAPARRPCQPRLPGAAPGREGAVRRRARLRCAA